MPTVDLRSALVLIDLMQRVVDQPLAPRSGQEVVETAVQLATGFRERDATVVLVRVERPDMDVQPPGSGFVSGLEGEGDVIVVKRTVGTFQSTDLHEQLRRRGVEMLVLAGIATNMGVESTAREGADLGYRLLFVEDAMTALTAQEHSAAIDLDLPRFGEVVSASELSFA